MDGILKKSFNEKGFSFIQADPAGVVTQDIFLHVRSIASGEDSRLFVRGARVEFDLVMVDSPAGERPQAQNVRLVPAVAGASSSRGRPKFWHPNGFGFILEESGQEHFVAAGSAPGGYLRVGDLAEFDVITHHDGRTEAINVRVVDWAPTHEPFDDELDMGSPAWAAQLAEMAEPESWNYIEKPAKDSFAILRSYIKYTFLRLNELPDHVRVSADQTHLAFNTGLVTPFQEPIYAVFHRRAEGGLGPPWVWERFDRPSSVALLRLFGGTLPPLAWYFDDPSQLVYNTNAQLNVNVEHVPHDPERFPEALKALSPQDLAGLVNAKAPEAVERVRRNYKTAIPQFYRDGKSGKGKMQLLLPVALLSRNNVELALAVDRPAPDVYLGRTVLSLDWAYNNARLLTRPDTDWLRP